MDAYIDDIEAKSGFINDFLIMKKAELYAKQSGIDNFSASRGWLEKFKKRHKLKLRKLWRGTHEVVKTNYDTFIVEISEIIKKYCKKNVYNMDETRIFYRMIPSKTVCKNSRKGFKNFKDRVSVMLCANMDASDKLNPLIIGKSKKPRCFKNFDQLDTVTYTNSKRAWMTSFIYTNWLKNGIEN